MLDIFPITCKICKLFSLPCNINKSDFFSYNVDCSFCFSSIPPVSGRTCKLLCLSLFGCMYQKSFCMLMSLKVVGWLLSII